MRMIIVDNIFVIGDVSFLGLYIVFRETQLYINIWISLKNKTEENSKHL